MFSNIYQKILIYFASTFFDKKLIAMRKELIVLAATIKRMEKSTSNPSIESLKSSHNFLLEVKSNKLGVPIEDAKLIESTLMAHEISAVKFIDEVNNSSSENKQGVIYKFKSKNNKLNRVYRKLNQLIKLHILELIEFNKSKISGFNKPKYRNGKIDVYGISLEISPWYGYIYLELIPAKKTWEVSECADYGFSLGGRECETPASGKDVSKYIQLFYEGRLEDTKQFEETHLGHLVFICAAEALLSEEVTQKLIEHDIPAYPPKDNRFHTFEYYVYNRDKVLNLNYCEYFLLRDNLSVFNV